MQPRVNVLHLITGLNTGGAEMMLYRLLSATNRHRFDPTVLSLMGHGAIGRRITALGIPVHTLEMSTARLEWSVFNRLRSFAHQLEPDLIQGWMYHGNLAAQWAGSGWRRRVPVIWNIRQSMYGLKYEKRSTAWIIRLGAWLSRWPSKIIYNARLSAQQHETLGYRSDKRIIILNGFDTQQFRPCLPARKDVRAELGLPETTLVIGLIARYHPMKDHGNFLEAAAQLVAHREVHFALAGHDVASANPTLGQQITALRLKPYVHLLGERMDIPQITAALDIACSSSWSEGFPNAVGEAMACGVPCVVTDVGDSAHLVGKTGIVVPPRDPSALAAAWQRLIEIGPEGRKALGIAARQRIETHFSLPAIVAQYEALYDSLVAPK